MNVIEMSNQSYSHCLYKGKTMQEIQVADLRTAQEEIRAGLNCPIELCYVQKVAHDVKTDRYQATFTASEKTAVLKVTDDVATFLTEHLRKHGMWVGRIEKGVLVEVNLLQP